MTLMYVIFDVRYPFFWLTLYMNDLNEFIEKAFDGLHTISTYVEEFSDTVILCCI